MKKLLLITTIFLSLIGCTDIQRIDNKEKAIAPITNNNKNPYDLIVLGVYSTRGGYLYIYKFGNDTIYWAEGLTQSYPVSLHVK